MWVKRSDKEVLRAKARAKCRRIFGAAALAIAISLYAAWYRGKNWYQHHASPYVPLNEIPHRLLWSAPFGLVIGLLFYRRLLTSARSVVCPKCGKIKNEDEQWNCSCGGHFEDVETMKEI